MAHHRVWRLNECHHVAMAQGGDETAVWRVGGTARPAAYTISAVVTGAAVVRWFSWALGPAWAGARSAGLWTGLAVGVCTFFWWVILRVRLEIGPEGVVAVNPWGTQRLRLDEITHVTLGHWGAEFHQTDGFKTTAYALGDMASGQTVNDRRFPEVIAAFERVRRAA